MASKWCLISWADGESAPVDPGFGQPVPPVHIGGGPIHGLPGGGHISTLPVFPFDPTVDIDNSLPTPPAHASGQPIAPGTRLKVKWLCGVGLIGVPDNTLPATPEPK